MFRRTVLKSATAAVAIAAFSGVALSGAYAEEYTKDHPLKVALVVHGTLGDKSFFDSAAAGMKKAEEGLPVEVKIIEAGNQKDRWEPALADAVDTGYDVVIAGTFEMTQYIAQLAPESPDTKFIIFDDAPDYSSGCCDNVLSIQYRTSTAAYLAGYAAAKVSTTGTLGEILGMEFKTVTDFAVGFDQGAKAANPDIKILKAVANTFSDPAKGKELALAQINQGADVVFPIAGGTGIGALQAARDEKKLAVGVDSDQASIFEESDPAQAAVIMTSVEKRVGESLYLALEETIEGKAPYGSSILLGVKEGAVGISKNEEYDTIVPADVRAEVDGLAEKISSGEIKVETTME